MLGMAPSFAAGQLRIYLYTQHVDMRRSFNGLHAIVQTEFQRDVRAGDLFVFLNRRLDRIKLLYGCNPILHDVCDCFRAVGSSNSGT